MTVRMRGRVTAERVDQGSKSERVAMVFDNGDQRYLLRIAGQENFGEPVVNELIDTFIDAEGHLHAQYFDIIRWDIDQSE